jgi:hypothetical protein
VKLDAAAAILLQASGVVDLKSSQWLSHV